MSDSNAGRSPTDHEQDVWTVANIITVLRLLLVPFCFAVLIRDEGSDVLAFALYAGAAGTDWVDGQIARRTGTVTAIGKVIDPLVDRLLIASGVLGLYLVGRLPLWLVVILIMRDVYLLWGAYRLERHRLRMPVTFAGKTTTAVLLAAFSLMILNWPVVTYDGHEILAGLVLAYIGLALSLSTAIQYTVLARRLVNNRA
ncbi:MAG: CDP-alcohol phosphatidyltransferase family protein [Coriobacteriia bacterium]|nr:CDP-alcohol phosphatidyltransferase family protein [Coriobacteriia bacterium]